MFVPTIEDIKTNIRVNNKKITEANNFIYENYQKEGDFIFQYNTLCKLLEYKRQVVLNALIIKGLIWCYLLNRKEENKGRKFWLYVKLYTHRRIINESLEDIFMLKQGLTSLQIMINPSSIFSNKM